MKEIYLKFNSTRELSEFISSTSANGYFEGRPLASDRSEDSNFFGTKTYSVANNLLLNGWQEGADKVNEYMCNFNSNATRPQTYNNITGFACNVGAYLHGSPLCMFDRRKVATPKKNITIAYDCSVSGLVDSKDIMKTAAKLFNVISGLQKSGVGVNLWVVNTGKSSDKKNKEFLAAAVNIKKAEDPFNVLQMVYPIVHSSMSRRHFFAVTERANTHGNWEHYGYVITNREDKLKLLHGLDIKTSNLFSYDDLQYMDEEQILKSLK